MKPGEIINLYEDYQEETKLIGKAKVLHEKGEGLTFILEDMPKDKQIVYGTKKLTCEIEEDCSYPKGYIKTFNKRYIYNIGPTPTTMIDDFEKDDDVDISSYPIQDHFYFGNDPNEEEIY